MWSCPKLAEHEDPAVSHTQELAVTFEKEPHLACFWLRGMLPNSAMKATSEPFDRTKVRFVGAPPAGPWPGGTYHTDGTGGEI